MVRTDIIVPVSSLFSLPPPPDFWNNFLYLSCVLEWKYRSEGNSSHVWEGRHCADITIVPTTRVGKLNIANTSQVFFRNWLRSIIQNWRHWTSPWLRTTALTEYFCNTKRKTRRHLLLLTWRRSSRMSGYLINPRGYNSKEFPTYNYITTWPISLLSLLVNINR